MSKMFKLWKFVLEVKLRKLPDKKRIEFLSNKLIKELNLNVDPSCECISIWIHGKKSVEVEASSDYKGRINCNYTGK
ncbi:hypothetical protein KM799_02425 [Clostridium tyrobutyricum]|uniref:hypothetical protein n=1 Tax=Clostridium tyrobutyricum TaxID=1519 RepID=UPI001C3873E4|nr:hypothetical protein [Clostridium tyrobutyricum]MBV4445334.1 hypothetical protein [Clostridium tyrobutyricum]MBV4445461.1 hypothetical protein [Clostridium tyrobutyricum]